jgi:uncharacterized membrane protein (DUF441 family)
MDSPSNRLVRSPNYKKLAEAMGVVAGLASALSVAVGLLAAHMAPHGLRRLTLALHLSKQPMMMKLAALIAGIAVAAATAAGVLRFCTWCGEQRRANIHSSDA